MGRREQPVQARAASSVPMLAERVRQVAAAVREQDVDAARYELRQFAHEAALLSMIEPFPEGSRRSRAPARPGRR